MTGSAEQGASRMARPSHRGRNAIIFACIVVAWLLLDQVTKAYFNAFEVGGSAGALMPGVIEFTLVRNTGAAWGAFNEMTIFLAVLSIIICVVVFLYLFVLEPGSSVLIAVALSMIFAGGLGNLIDRLMNGYVIDFLEFGFFDFPVFNIADIGVTCGVALFFIGYFIQWWKLEREARVGNHGERTGSDDS